MDSIERLKIKIPTIYVCNCHFGRECILEMNIAYITVEH